MSCKISICVSQQHPLQSLCLWIFFSSVVVHPIGSQPHLIKTIVNCVFFYMVTWSLCMPWRGSLISLSFTSVSISLFFWFTLSFRFFQIFRTHRSPQLFFFHWNKIVTFVNSLREKYSEIHQSTTEKLAIFCRKKNLEICQLFTCKNRSIFKLKNWWKDRGLCQSVIGWKHKIPQKL